jgi:hypothetical protein
MGAPATFKTSTPQFRKEENRENSYIWTIWNFVRDPLGTSVLKEGATGAAGDESPGEPSHGEGRRDRSQTSQAQPFEKK